MIYGSVCSGIEAATVAWHPLGMSPAWFCEIEPFPSAVLAHHYPQVPNYGDFTALISKDHPRAGVDLLVGGTPCQAFSVAGLRGGLADPRGNLALAFVALVDSLRPRWVVWENVPGVLSSGGGRDFGSFLGALGELGYGWAYRVVDAQYFGLAQRRKRVFVVASRGDWRRSAAVLFEPESLRWDSPPRRETGTGVAGAVTGRAGSGGPDDNTGQASHIVPAGSRDVEAYQCHGSNVGPMGTIRQGSGSVADERYAPRDVCNALHTNNNNNKAPMVLSIQEDKQNGITVRDTAGTVRSTAPGSQQGGSLAFVRRGVRRLMPHELERLQGFPDGYTLIPGQMRKAVEDDYAAWFAARYPDATREEIERFAKDGPRAKALGNSMAVPCMRWIGRRLLLVDATPTP